MAVSRVTTLFCDIGGVLMTNGWDRHHRAQAAKEFGFDLADFESRHQLCFYLYEIGKISLADYLMQILFYVPRQFTMQQFIDFMYAQSQPYDDMIAFVKELRRQLQLKVVLFSNEGRELAEYRLKHYRLTELADIAVVSSFVNLRKPDKEMYRMAIDLVQQPPENIVYIEDRQLFVEIASHMGIHAIKHVNLAETQTAIQRLL